MSPLRILKILAVMALLIISGCGYTIQSRADLPFEEVSVGEIENSTPEPRLREIMAKTLTEVLMQYGFQVRSSANRRIEGEITRFDLKILSERELTATEYEVIVEGKFRVVDEQKGTATALPGLKSPFVTSFNSGGRIESVLALKELATQTALRDLSQELVREILLQKETAR